MKKKRSLVIAALTFAFTSAVLITACKKSPSPTNENLVGAATGNADEVHVGGKTFKKVAQKFYYPNSQNSLILIKQLTGHLRDKDDDLVKGRLIEADNIDVDSALFVLEAALNYDFDFQFEEDNLTTDFKLMDTSAFTIPIDLTSNEVSSEDLEGVYVELQDHMMDLLDNGDDRVIRVIDVERYVGDNEVTFQAKTITFINVSKEVNCNTFPYSGNNLYASAVGDGTVALTGLNFAKDKINFYFDYCGFPPRQCPVMYYQNVSTLVLKNDQQLYNSALYYRNLGCGPPPNAYEHDATQLTPTQLNSFVSGCISLANGNKPTSNHRVISPFIEDWALDCMDNVKPSGCFTPSSMFPIYRCWWKITITYGTTTNVGC